VVAVSIGSTIGACAAFLLGRFLLRDWLDEQIKKYPVFGAVDRAIARNGFYIVFLLRLSPVIPFNLLNYALALTNVSFWAYALASWIGMFPATVMFVYIGAALQSIQEVVSGSFEGSLATKLLFWGGLVATVVVAVLVTWVARNAIKEALRETTPPQDEQITDKLSTS